MLSNKQIETLKSSWGEKADSMGCLAEVRVYDPLSSWECYIYAINPEDEDEIMCIINGFNVEVTTWRLSEMRLHYNAYGESPIIDKEYRPRRVAELFKKISEVRSYERA